MPLYRVHADLSTEKQNYAKDLDIPQSSSYSAVENVHWYRRRGAAHVFGHRAEAAEDQGGAHRVAEIGKDRQEGVGIPASFCDANAGRCSGQMMETTQML